MLDITSKEILAQKQTVEPLLSTRLNAYLLESDTNKTGRAVEDELAHFVYLPM